MFLFRSPVGLNFNDMPRKLLRNSSGLICGAAACSHPELSGYRRFVTAASGPPTHSMYILRWCARLWYIGNLKMSNINFCQRDIAAWDRLSHPDDSGSFATCAFRGGLTCGVQNDHPGDVSAPNGPVANTAGCFFLEEYRVIGQDLRTSLQVACQPNCDGEFWGERLWKTGKGGQTESTRDVCCRGRSLWKQVLVRYEASWPQILFLFVPEAANTFLSVELLCRPVTVQL